MVIYCEGDPVMKVVGAEKSDTALMIHLDKGDGQTHIHIVPDGIIEDRMEAWGLETREEALDLVLVQSHEDQDGEIPDRFRAEDLSTAKGKLRNIVKAKSKGIDYANGISREHICSLNKLPQETEEAIRHGVRDELRSAARVKPVGRDESLARYRRTRSDVAAGFQRRSEEILADEIISDNPELKLAPRIRDEETVGLSVKFT